jgi:hypothetical protein
MEDTFLFYAQQAPCLHPRPQLFRTIIRTQAMFTPKHSASLKKLVHDQYGGRLADVLDVKVGLR